MKQKSCWKAGFSVLVATALIAGQASAQNGRWPSPAGAKPLVLRAYGSGTMEPAMRESAIVFGNQRGVIVNFKSGPVEIWKTQAIRDGDIIFADSQLLMNNLIQRDLNSIIDPTTTRAVTMHTSSIMVRRGNPKAIRGIKDLGKQGVKLLIVAGPDERRWEDAVRRAGGDELAAGMRRNVGYFPATSAEAQALWESDAGYDAWLVLRPGGTESPKVTSRQEEAAYRACVMALTYRTTQKDLAGEFIDFILSAQGQEIFTKWGGQTR